MASDRSPATIREVARVAGVGLGTVSRVLNDHPSVSAETRERVRNAINDLGYQPNLQARRLVKGRTETVGFVLGNRDFIDPFHAKVLAGAQRYFAEAGHQVVYISLEYSRDGLPDEMVLPKIISLRGVLDGVIVAGTNYPNLLTALDHLNMPYVVFGNNLVGNEIGCCDSVSFDDERGMAELVERIFALGHRHIWYIGRSEYPWFNRRYEGYARVMRSHGLETLTCSSLEAENSTEYGYKSAISLIESGNKVSAVCCGNDAIAYGAWKAVRERGLKVPEDINITGFDDRDICALTDPQMTSVRPYLEEIGGQCARLLIEKTNNDIGSLPGVVTKTEVVMRGTTSACLSSC